MDNNQNVETLEVQQNNPNTVQPTPSKKNKSSMPIIILLVVIILGLVGYIVYDKVLNKEEPKTTETAKKDNNKTTTDNTNNNGTSDKTTTNTKTTLLDKELTIQEICTNTTGICEKEVGKFTLGGKEHTLKVYINMDDEYGEESTSNTIIIDSKKIAIGFQRAVRKMVKIGDNYLAIGSINGIQSYVIDIYDSNLSLVKTYNGYGTSDNPSEYFKASGNSFIRYNCNTSNMTDDGENQILEKYKVTIENGIFSETKISEENAFCQQQW